MATGDPLRAWDARAEVSDSLGRGPFLLLTGVRPNTNALTFVVQIK